MKKLLCLFVACFLAIGCGKGMSQPGGETHVCANQKLPPNLTEIDEAMYQGKTVYVFVPGCCDIGTIVMDEQCNQICWMGGITGRGDGKCPDFGNKAQQVKTIWTKRK